MLHKLPKDLLVKLVATIREDTEKKYVELLRQCSNSEHRFCKECDAFSITSQYDKDTIFNSHNRKFQACHACRSNFCEITIRCWNVRDVKIYFMIVMKSTKENTSKK